MNILLLYPEAGIGVRWTQLLEVGMAGAIIRRARHRLGLLHYKHPTQLGAIEAFTAKFDPALIVAMVAWDQWRAAQELMARVRQAAPKPMLVVAGAYPTLDPESAIAHAPVDAVLVGEVEAALEDLITRLAERRNITDTPNFWFKPRGAAVLKNALRPLIEDLDALPLTDRALYDHGALVQSSGGGFPMLAGRGCPHDCAFCYMPRLKQSASGKGEFARARSPLSLVGEVRAWASKEAIEWVDFVDEYFPQSPEWLRPFCETWKVQARLPFRFTAVAERLTPEALAMLRGAGCEGIRLGVETGDEEFRAKVADRNLSNARLEAVCEEARRLGIAVELHAMVGLPMETPALARSTAALCERLQPARVIAHVFHPIIGTPLHAFCTEHGYLKTAAAQMQWSARQTALQAPAISDAQVLGAYDDLRALDRRLVIAQAPEQPAQADLVHLLDQAAVESALEVPLEADWWSREHDKRFCLIQAVGSKATFPVELGEDACLVFGIGAGPCPYGIRFPRPVYVEVRLLQGEYEDILFAQTLSLTPKRSRRGWFDARLALAEWPAGPAQLVLNVQSTGTVPVAPVYVAWARPCLVRGDEQDFSAPGIQATRRIAALEAEQQALREENEHLRSERDAAREELEGRKQRVAELHVQSLDVEKELETLRAEKAEWTRLREEIENSMGGKIKKLFKRD